VGKFPRSLKKYPTGRVLVVDDEPLVRWSIAETLRAGGYEIAAAGDARSAIRAVLEPAPIPDAVLLDLRLPDCHDLGLLEALHQLLPFTPIILMTAFATPELADAARHLGAFAVLNKPFDLAELDRLLASALS
jgi:DNA-binding NtrC family response regulator